MYLYLYDTYLNAPKYDGVLTRIETRLIDLGINGRVEKLSILKNLKELLLDGVKEGARTVVAVGNDSTFRKVFNVVASLPVTLGYIPVGTNPLANVLGIPPEEKACDVLSQRIIERVDLGKVNDHYFFSVLEVPKAEQVTIECNRTFRIHPRRFNESIQICNLGEVFRGRCDEMHNPHDGKLEAMFHTAKRKRLRSTHKLDSVFSVKELKIFSREKAVTLFADGETPISTPAIVNVAPHKLRLIVGKKRMF